MKEHPTGRTSFTGKWGKRAGMAAFLFFFLKGLVWLAIMAVGAYYALY